MASSQQSQPVPVALVEILLDRGEFGRDLNVPGGQLRGLGGRSRVMGAALAFIETARLCRLDGARGWSPGQSQ
ncbi:MAG: hypothetical protein VX015_09865 [Planctomycetota bacterium]|nr:hypothetical protein [Planctomycetota bacterium]